MVRYSDFSLHEKMTLKRDKTHPHGCYLIPPKEELSATFFQQIKTFNEFTKEYVLKKGTKFEESNLDSICNSKMSPPQVKKATQFKVSNLDSIWNSEMSPPQKATWKNIKFKNQNGENVTVHGVMVILEMLN